jgi:hypothetical protein
MTRLDEFPNFAQIGGGGGGAVFQEGVVSGGTLTRDSSVQVTVAELFAHIEGDGVTGWGYDLSARQRVAATVLAAIPAAATNPRVDQVIMRLNAAGAAPTVERLAGSEQAGATLSNAAGDTSRSAIVVPAGARVIHEFIVGTSGVDGAQMRDRRPWAAGAFAIARTPALTVAITNTTGVLLHADLQKRIECGGGLIVATLHGAYGNLTKFILGVDGAASDYGSSAIPGNATNHAGAPPQALALPSAGSHLLAAWHFSYDGASRATQTPAASHDVAFVIRELPRVADNGAS